MIYELNNLRKHFHFIITSVLNPLRILALIFFITAIAQSTAQSVPQHGGVWVHDYAEILSPQTKAQLESLLMAERDSTSNQIAVLVMRNLEGGDIDEFANRVFNEWKLGDAKKDNGVLF